MFVHHISYQYENGNVEEFVGSGLTPSSALQNSVYSAKSTVSSSGEAFTLARVNDITASRRRPQQNASINTRMYLAALL